MGNLESLVKNTARVVLAPPRFVAETVLSIDNLKGLKRLKSVEAVQKLEPVWMRWMRYGGAAEARVCYISSTIFKWAANGILTYGVLDARGDVPHGMPLFANIFFGGMA